MPQLVGRSCVRCGERIADELESRFCSICGSPVHDRCAVAGPGAVCPSCGAVVSDPVAPALSSPPTVVVKPKSEIGAFALNYLLPGAGFWYLGRPRWGIINLVVVLVIGVVLAIAIPEATFDRLRGPIAAGIGGGSGALEMGLAKRQNLLVKQATGSA